ncbi:MAG: hypothetical protein ACFWT5_09215 [Pseudomonas helleri]|jgi:hypothetical protein|uniref:hypothetical protein n=1 Tax=Pseudomonas helleri TaxID=1608996 RepID=UPI003A102697
MTDVSALEVYAGQMAEAAAMSGAASAKQHHYIHGDANSDVITESGPVPCIAKQARLSSESTAGLEGRMADPAQGAGLSAWKLSKLNKCISNAAEALDHLEVPIWAFADKAIGYVEGGDPATWDWGPAFVAADKSIDSVSRGGCISVRAGIYGVASECVITGHGKWVKGFGSTSTELRAIKGYAGDILKLVGSSYCKVTGIKGVGAGGENQKVLYMPYRVDSGVTLQNYIDDVQAENCATGVLLENPVHCTVKDVRTTRDCKYFGLHSQFIAGVGAGQGGTNLRLIGGWFQSHAETGTSCRINSNLCFTSIGSQFEHGRFGLVLRACAGATVTSPLIEDCGLPMSLQGCTNLTVISPTLDSGTSSDTGSVIQPLIDIDGGKGIKILGITSIADNKDYIDYLIRFSNAAYGVFPDNVLIDEYQSEGGKGLLASENVSRLRIFKDGVMAAQGIVIQKARLQPTILTAPPSNPATGEEFNCDGVLWKPVAGGRARVIYSGSGVYTLIKNF